MYLCACWVTRIPQCSSDGQIFYDTVMYHSPVEHWRSARVQSTRGSYRSMCRKGTQGAIFSKNLTFASEPKHAKSKVISEPNFVTESSIFSGDCPAVTLYTNMNRLCRFISAKKIYAVMIYFSKKKKRILSSWPPVSV